MVLNSKHFSLTPRFRTLSDGATGAQEAADVTISSLC